MRCLSPLLILPLVFGLSGAVAHADDATIQVSTTSNAKDTVPGRVTWSAGPGTFTEHSALTFQGEIHASERTSVVMNTRFFLLGFGSATSVSVRPYLTGSADQGLYLQAGADVGTFVHTSVWTQPEYGVDVMVGPHAGVGKKWSTPKGLVIDLNAGVTGYVDVLGDFGDFGDASPFFLAPKLSVTFGSRGKSRRSL